MLVPLVNHTSAAVCCTVYTLSDALLSAPQTGLIAKAAHLRENGGAICGKGKKKKLWPSLARFATRARPAIPGISHRNPNQSQILQLEA